MKNKFVLFSFTLVSSLFILVQCAQGSGFKNISVDELYEKVKKDGNIFILDVRTDNEYLNDGHIKGSKLIPVQVIKERLSEINDNKNNEIYVICRSGGRSSNASEILFKKGFKKVYNVLGGMNAWKSKKYPME
ncbi:MAG: rhodanese-like domain-containing protein [Spirochaetota bacterium]|nr:rhodanese-like domain-containing protein [Spirochaetota bacterium]